MVWCRLTGAAIRAKFTADSGSNSRADRVRKIARTLFQLRGVTGRFCTPYGLAASHMEDGGLPMARKLTVAAAQTGPVLGGMEEGVQSACAMVKEGARQGVDIICFPEVFLAPFFPNRLIQDY